jgi:hypothetical protein
MGRQSQRRIEALRTAMLAVADARERLGFLRAKATDLAAEEQHARVTVQQCEERCAAALAALGGGAADVEQPSE